MACDKNLKIKRPILRRHIIQRSVFEPPAENVDRPALSFENQTELVRAKTIGTKNPFSELDRTRSGAFAKYVTVTDNKENIPAQESRHFMQYYLLSRDEADELLLLTDDVIDRAQRIMKRVMKIQDDLAAQYTAVLNDPDLQES